MRPAARRAVLAALALLALIGWGAAPAAAGGPTSVLLVNVADGRTASAHVSQGRYAEIFRVFDQQLGAPTMDTAPTGQPEVRVVWLIHDVTAWRLDSVVRDGKDVWVSTRTDETGTGILWDGPERWHRLTAGAARSVDDLLDDLGVIGPVTPTSTGASAGPAAEPVAGPETPAAPRVAEATSGWPLALAAALLGAGAGLVLGRLGWVRSRRTVDGHLRSSSPVTG